MVEGSRVAHHAESLEPRTRAPEVILKGALRSLIEHRHPDHCVSGCPTSSRQHPARCFFMVWSWTLQIVYRALKRNQQDPSAPRWQAPTSRVPHPHRKISSRGPRRLGAQCGSSTSPLQCAQLAFQMLKRQSDDVAPRTFQAGNEISTIGLERIAARFVQR